MDIFRKNNYSIITTSLKSMFKVLLKNILLFILLFGLGSIRLQGQDVKEKSEEANIEVKIAIRAHSGTKAAIKKWSATVNYLNASIEGYNFVMLPLVTFDQMHEVIKNNQIDFVLTNPTSYVDLSINYGISRIATLNNRREKNGYTEFGSVAFVRADRDDINLLTDITGKSIMGVHGDAFGGWQMLYRELLEKDIDPYMDCSEVMFSPNGTQEEIVHQVILGNVDIGTVRTGILENLDQKGEIDLQSIKIIEAISDDFPLTHTTRLYPEWPFSKLKNTDEELAQNVIIALLQIRKNNPAAIKGNYTGWKVPLSYNQVLVLLKTLKVSPFDDYKEISITTFIKSYIEWFLLGLISLITLSILLLKIRIINKRLTKSKRILEFKVKERTTELRNSNQQLAENKYLLEKAQEIGKTGSWNLDLFENKLIWSDMAYDIFGLTAGSSLTYELFLESIHPDDREYVNKEWLAALEGKPYDIEHRLLIDGKTKWVIEKAEFTFDDDKKAISAIGFTQDITKRKLTEKELKEYQEHLEELVDKRTNELKEKNKDLEKFNDLFIGREFRIKELKDRVKELESGL